MLVCEHLAELYLQSIEGEITSLVLVLVRFTRQVSSTPLISVMSVYFHVMPQSDSLLFRSNIYFVIKVSCKSMYNSVSQLQMSHPHILHRKQNSDLLVLFPSEETQEA